MLNNIFCNIKKIDDFDIFRLDHQLYLWFEDTSVKEVYQEINITKSLKQMYNFGKEVYTKLIENISLKNNINKIEPNYIEDKKNFVLNYCKNIQIYDFEKDRIYSYIYDCLDKADVNLDSFLNPGEYYDIYRELIMVLLTMNINDRTLFLADDKTTRYLKEIINLLEKNLDNVNVDNIYTFIQNIKSVPTMDDINTKILKDAIAPFIKYCGLPYYFSDKSNDISFEIQNILDTTNTTIPCKKRNAIGRNLLPLNNFINICIFIFIIEESNKGTFEDLDFDIEKAIILSYKDKDFNIESLINTYSDTNIYNFEYKDFITYINKLNNLFIDNYYSFFNKKLKNKIFKRLKGKKLINNYDLENLATFLWECYFTYFQSNKSFFDIMNCCTYCGKSSKENKWHYLRGEKQGEKLCEECYKRHLSTLNCKRVNTFRKSQNK